VVIVGEYPRRRPWALLIGLAEQFGRVYFPTYAVVLTFLIMVVVLSVRPQGLLGKVWMVAMPDTRSAVDQRMWIEKVHPAYWALGILLLIIPSFASDFVMFQIMGWTFILGLIALSLMFLGGYGGMVSLAQMTFAGFAG
jgi:ABC-type branched-subunit amino acid transport system permease subunit